MVYLNVAAVQANAALTHVCQLRIVDWNVKLAVLIVVKDVRNAQKRIWITLVLVAVRVVARVAWIVAIACVSKKARKIRTKLISN